MHHVCFENVLSIYWSSQIFQGINDHAIGPDFNAFKRMSFFYRRVIWSVATCAFTVQGKMRAAIGKANLLTTKKFRQFRQLCNENLVS